ncbi:MAG: SIMPL domain-containing protein [Colwellia sp.]
MKVSIFTQLKNTFSLNVNRKLLFLVSLVGLIFPMQVWAFDNEGIEVSGQGSVVVAPDNFSLTLTITERGRVPSKLKVLVDKKSNAVINAAKNLAITEANISSARVNLRIVEEKPSIQVQGVDFNNTKYGSVFIDGQTINQQSTRVNQAKKPLFELSRQITVNFNGIDEYDDFLGHIIKINVSRISPLSMSVEGREAYYQQALLQAINHAKKKAARMAEQAGQKLGKLQLIKELSRNNYRPMYAEAMMSNSRSSAHTSLVGNQTISARVLVRFNLKD